MRLGSRTTYFQKEDCLTRKLYGNVDFVDERHRHRYEVNPDMVEKLEDAGLMFVGKDETGKRMEILEIKDHPYYVGVQFHPEFKSRPNKASPVFLGLILAASGQVNSFSEIPFIRSSLKQSNNKSEGAHAMHGGNGVGNGNLTNGSNISASNGIARVSIKKNCFNPHETEDVSRKRQCIVEQRAL